jgi:hypothetical protein
LTGKHYGLVLRFSLAAATTARRRREDGVRGEMRIAYRRRNRRTMLWIAIAVAAIWWVLEALIHSIVFADGDLSSQLLTGDRHELWMRSLVAALFVGFGIYADHVLRATERSENERAALQAELEESLTKVLGGFLPICGYCKKIRIEASASEGREVWKPVESYLSTRTDLEFSHSVCPECMRRHFPDAVAER